LGFDISQLYVSKSARFAHWRLYFFLTSCVVHACAALHEGTEEGVFWRKEKRSRNKEQNHGKQMARKTE